MNTSSSNVITVSNLDILIERKDIKNLHIGVYPPNGKIRVATPLHIDNEAVRLAVISKLSWIKKQKEAFENQPRQTKREMVSGESHYFIGKRYLLSVVHTVGKHQIIKNHSKLELYVNQNTTVENRQKILDEFYRQHLKVKINKLIDKWQNIIGVNISSWKIQRMKTKWGSCNIDDKRLLFNLELAKKPIETIEYVVVHEMTHLLERHHNENFKMLMDRSIPKWRVLRRRLNEDVLSSMDTKGSFKISV